MTEHKSKGRRGFFAALGAVAAAGVAVKISSNPVVATQPATSEPVGDGYRLSEHIKKYYRSTTL